MNIKHSHVIDPSGDTPPDAIKIDVAGMRFLVNRHTGAVTIEGADHVDYSAGMNNTLEIHACPNLSSMRLQMLELPWLLSIGESLLVGDPSHRHPGMRGSRTTSRSN